MNNRCDAASDKKQKVSDKPEAKTLKDLEKNMIKMLILTLMMMNNVIFIFELGT